MSVWDAFRKAKDAGQRLLDRMDEVEREAREGDVDAAARRMAFQSSETELSGGVGDLGELGMDEPAHLGAADEAGPEAEDRPPEEIEAVNSFFSELKRQHVDEEYFGVTQIEPELKTDPEDTGDAYLTISESTDASGVGEFSDLTQVGPVREKNDALLDGELTATGEPTASGQHTGTLELTATGETTASIRVEWANSLSFDQAELSNLLRADHFPQLAAAPVALLVELSQFEQKLMGLGEELGHACRKLIEEVLPEDEEWEAAVWTTGAHWDHAVRSALIGLNQSVSPVNARTLGWAFWPFTDELLSAAVGLEDPCGMSEIIAKIEYILDERWARVSGGSEDLEAEGDHLPILPRGLFTFEGFKWLE
jgi:hypothetical protein